MSSNPLDAQGMTQAEGPDYAGSGPVRVTANIPPFAPGTVVADKYLIEREIAEGGLGVVVVATHVGLGRSVAIKYLKPSVRASPDLVERFRREAQLAVSIRSDHIVRVFDVGNDPAVGPYMVMELLEGEDLGARLERGPLPIEEAIDYIVQACDALAVAHALGIVHRDLKPENLFLAKRPGAPPILKILDFGISKVYEKRKSLPEAPRLRQMTDNGLRLGTPVYMSPEQLVSAAQVDARSDIWSLGVVLYELLTQSLPFDGDTVSMLGANIVASPPIPLRARLPEASPALEACILKCLEKNPQARYRNVAELVEELASFEAPGSMPRIVRIKHVVTEGGESIRPPRPLGAGTPGEAFTPILAALPPAPLALSAGPPSKRSRLPFVAGAIAVGLLGIVGVVLLAASHRGDRPAAAASSSSAAPPVVAPVEEKTIATPVPAESPPAPSPALPAVTAPASAARPAPSPARSAPTKKRHTDYSEFGDRR